MMLDGDGTWHSRLRWGRCPKCDTALPSRKGGLIVCETCGLGIAVKPCHDCKDGMIRQPDGYGCVEWTSCYSCDGRGWT